MDDPAPKVVTPHVEMTSRKQPGKTTASFIKTMDKLVLTSAVGLLALWFLGNVVLWLIGGSAGGAASLASSGGASAVGNQTAVAHMTANPDSEQSASQSESRTLDDEHPKSDHEHDDHDLDSSAKTAGQQKANQFKPSDSTPTETSFRPSYKPKAESKSESSFGSRSEKESTGFSSPDKTLDRGNSRSTVAPSSGRGDTDSSNKNWSPTSPKAEVDLDGGSSDRHAEQGETELKFGADAGPIEKLEIPEEVASTELGSNQEVAGQAPAFEKPKTYPMRVWTSSQGNLANLALIKVEGDLIFVVDDKGKEFELSFDRFSQEDQDYVLDAIKN